MTKRRYDGTVAPQIVTEPENSVGRRDRADAPAPDPLHEILEEIDQPEGQEHLVERGRGGRAA